MRKRLINAAFAATFVSLGMGALTAGCLNRPIDRIEPRTTSTVVERLTQSSVDKIDLLLAIDNSISMGDKQAILADAVPDLVNRLVTPICVNPDTKVPTGNVVDANGDCPAGEEPEFKPIQNINVGIISSSLGALTANQCDGGASTNPTHNDRGRLLSRGSGGTAVPTYNSLGFLAWDPANIRGGETVAATLINNFRDMVVGVDQVGCGYEMQLESIYRFLADPEPYDTLTREGGYLKKNGVDQVVITQRKDFMRANSLLAILVLTDENDCSVDVSGQGFFVLGSAPFYKSTEECAANPNDQCCTSCALPNPAGCSPDPTNCGAGQGTASANTYTQAEDHPNLRCFDQKRRYGVNFLYPVQRYINAFSRPKIDPSRSDLAGDTTTNPIFDDLSGAGVAVRDPGLVFVAGVVGVPWQAIARRCPAGEQCDPNAAPDLNFGFKTYTELAQEGSLEKIIGDPDNNIAPTDPFMVEAVGKRSGTSDLTGGTLPGMNGVNGNDRNIPTSDDLQYACIFDLPTPVDPGPDCGPACEMDASCDDPLCDPNDKSRQINAKAYPGLRELALLNGMKDQGIFASICPQQLGDSNASNFGYRPAVGAIIDRLKQELGGQCLPRKLTPDPESGAVPCLVLEASKVEGGCDCNAIPGRKAVPETIDGAPNPTYNAVKAAGEDEFNPGWNCFCEIAQLTGDELNTCQNTEDIQDINGWCYVDATQPNPVGNPALVSECAPDERRLVRFAGQGQPQAGATVFITCSGQ